jgi:ankyrin repeat protein
MEERQVTMRSMSWGKALARTLIPLAAGVVLMAGPAQAQFSDGYKFLEAVRKRDGYKVEEALNEPGSTIVNARDVTSGDTALHIVVARRDLAWTRFLIQKGANVNTRNGRGSTPLQLAASLGFLEGVAELVAAKADVDQPNDSGETPLMTALHRRDIPMMRILLAAGADPDRADNSGRSARDYAKLEGRSNPLLAEIEKNAKPRGKSAGGQAVYGPTF